MNIFIRDDQGLDTVLMMDGYSKEQRQSAKQAIRAQFRETASKVFQDVLGKPLPESITVNMAISDREEMKGESAARLASFNVELSRGGSSFFTIREITVKTILEQSDSELLKSTVIHEMFHAADQYMLKSNREIFEDVEDDIYEDADRFNYDGQNAHIALLNTLQVFDHYRAEGVALLGESLLMKTPFGVVAHATAQFCKTFELTMMRAQKMIGGYRGSAIFDKETFHKAYHVAPIILLLVLEQGEDIPSELAQKALRCLGSGKYDLTDGEIATIMRSAITSGVSSATAALDSSGIQGLSRLFSQETVGACTTSWDVSTTGRPRISRARFRAASMLPRAFSSPSCFSTPARVRATTGWACTPLKSSWVPSRLQRFSRSSII